ncbi:MAG: type I-B CRISPR-associated protein Cas7/Cst2/DevR [Thermoflexales bacterium]|nr:type I-B CRISPR-associated protein Cas7/Cst2/DevR [Thermoflexales bacterium]MDW8054370.1 type I-B CRISPR-associated protein Cas7/Cst2/DevR [Anaerolineae bacterium]MDW8292829.1 type I-B CRISPR-associated protein Cas7/Cst2/DevR [Anaerolineae bacterium]
MSFITGLLLIDAPASALNNLGQIEGERYENVTDIKVIKTREGTYPYVSAQAFRYWLRKTLEAYVPEWRSAPTFREEKIAYTDANPIRYWDDDLLGYMRAPSKRESARTKREASAEISELTPTAETVTRAAPFRVSTLVSIAPVQITSDYGTMTRVEGKPVPHEHQFYRTTLKGLFSLNLRAAGTFTYINRTGFLNLDEPRVEEAKRENLEHLEKEKAYRLPKEERARRVAALLKGLSQLEGGAKLTLHYTDVSPALAILAVTRGGNHIFAHTVGADSKGLPLIKLEALAETLRVYQDALLSDVFVGWTRGYLDEQRERFERALAADGALSGWQTRIRVMHPREAFLAMAEEINKNLSWLD